MSLSGPGTIIIKPLSAKLKRDTETLGKMDPFCVVTLGSQKQKTKPHNNAGKFPSWTEKLNFRRSDEYLI